MDAKEAKQKADKALEIDTDKRIEEILFAIDEAAERGFYQIGYNNKEHIRTYNIIVKKRSYFENELGFILEFGKQQGDSTEYVKIYWGDKGKYDPEKQTLKD